MQHTSLSAKESSKSKHIQISRNEAAIQQSISKKFKRLKSNHDLHDPQFQTSHLPAKPQSSASRRPLSSRKPSEVAHSHTTTSSGIGESEIKQMINGIFSHSKKIKQFLQKENLSQNSAYSSLINNQLFLLSLVTMVSNKNQEEAGQYVEKSCVAKLERMIAMEKQKKKCEGIESKISALIDDRIQALSRFN